MEYKIGQVIQGVVTGIKPYGAFVKLDNEYSGLIHISEISDIYVNNVGNFVRLGEKVVVKIIDIDRENRHMKLSLKAIGNHRQYRTLTKNMIIASSIGFKSLEEALPKWIEEENKK